MAATRSVNIEPVLMSITVAIKNQKIAIPRKPEMNEEKPFVEMIKLIKKLATTIVHQGNTV